MSLFGSGNFVVASVSTQARRSAHPKASASSTPKLPPIVHAHGGSRNDVIVVPRWFRRRRVPIAYVALAGFLNAMLIAPLALAQSEKAVSSDGTAEYDQSTRAALAAHIAKDPAPKAGGTTARDSIGDLPPALASVPTALAAEASGGGVSAQATALPSGAATQMGMGESFSMQLSTGTAGYSVPLTLHSARGRVQPKLDLSYSSSGGFGLAGVGWSFGAPAIARQTDRGVPKYDDRSSWHAEQDRFVLGGSELVPICTVSSGGCSGALPSEVMPTWANGWQYFRSRIEGAFLRVFWSPDHRTWRVQGKDGNNMEFGVPLDGTAYEGALERNPEATTEIFRWYVVRQYDGQTTASAPKLPVNPVVYRYTTLGNSVYLSDIFDTSPAANPTSTDLSTFAHHTSVFYEARPDVAVSYRGGYRTEVALRVSEVDVSSKDFAGPTTAARSMVRRYHFRYDSLAHRSLLLSAAMEGRCATAVFENTQQRLPATACPRLPPMSFEYQTVQGAGQPLFDSQGYAFESFDHTVRDLDNSPPHSLDESDAGLMDVNGDGLIDLLVTAPGKYAGKHGLFLNHGTGFAPATTMAVAPTANVTDTGVLSLHSAAVAALDFDSDGVINLLHMPQANRYAVFSPVPAGSGSFKWVGREVSTTSQQNVKINFTQGSPNIRVIDVNGDGLVDIVYSSATELQTFFSLGRYPGGDGQFGSARWTSASTATINNDPVVSCVPWSSTPVRFSDPDTQIADMNGDGLADIVRVRDGEMLYWPGRGNGYWGTGDRGGCPSGTGSFAEGRAVVMSNPPRYGVADPGSLQMADVNGDGLSDLVEIRSNGVDIYLNDNGASWTVRHTIDDTPFRPAGSNYVRLVDINGSGTPDILWGRAAEYRYIDLTGGQIPELLIKAKNGLGKTASFEYASSTNVMLAATASGNPWSTVAPLSMPLLTRTVVRDHLELIGRPSGAYITEYTYRNPVFEGRQREFRGFAEGIVSTIGDGNSPTSYQRTVFQLGECPAAVDGENVDVCSPSERWKDNWREALKGLSVLTETYDATGVYHSTEHTTYKLRQLYAGLDGRRVVVVSPTSLDGYLYDTATFDRLQAQTQLDEVVVDAPDIAHTETRSISIRATAQTAHLHSSTQFDDFGNVLESRRNGCVSGCPNGADETIISHSDYTRPTGDDSGWGFRETTSYMTGSVHTEHYRESQHEYDANGNLKKTYITLWGTLPLARSHAVAGAAIAPAPPGQSGGVTAPVQVLMADMSYDMFGNALWTKGASGRCSGRVADANYAALTVTGKATAGALDPNTQCGSVIFTHNVTYDRGLETVLTSTDPVAQPSSFTFDGFGRLLSASQVDPDRSGQLAALPMTTVSYVFPTDPDVTPYTETITRTQVGADVSINTYAESRTYTDGMGRTIASFAPADPAAGDGGDWVMSGQVAYDAKGAVARVYEPSFYTGDTAAGLVAPAATARYKSAENDAFGHGVRSYGFERNIEAMIVPHALSMDVYDAADILATSHQGTYATNITDGHGRGVQRIERIKVGATVESRLTLNQYLPTGDLVVVTQRRAGSADVTRWMKFDSFGRLVLNVEPNTSVGFSADPNTQPNNVKAYRYAYDDAGDMVGYSDARGCGANRYFDAGGRMLAEDRSPCLASQPAYSAPNLATGDGTEAFYRYDTADPDSSAGLTDAGGQTLAVNPAVLTGRLVSVAGLGAKAIYAYDARGRGTGVAAHLAKPGLAATSLSARYTPRWYIKKTTLDASGRVASTTTGAMLPQLLGTGGKSEVTSSYAKSGRLSKLSSSYGGIYSKPVSFADGRAQSFAIGDGTPAPIATRYFTYDARNRVQDIQTYRGTPSLWSIIPAGSSYVPPSAGDDPTRQLLLEDVSIGYDEVNNIVQVDDQRLAEDWPATAKPVRRKFEYDDLYRLTRTTFEYPGAPDAWKSPFAYEDATPAAQQPMPHGSFATRLTEQRYQYDWLGNISQSTDDQQAFWDRSTGDRAHGTATSGPHQLRSATDRALASTSPRKGDLSAAYDAAGNLSGLVIRRDGACLPAGASCWQRFDYEWDEVGELTRARRWDLTTTPDERTANGSLSQALPGRAPDAELAFAYGAAGVRVLKAAKDKVGVQRHTAYVFDTLELRSVPFDGSDYTLAPQSVVLHLPGGPVSALVVYILDSVPSTTTGKLHLLLSLADQVSSTSFVIDNATAELVEYSTYQSYGAADGDYRPNRWKGYREPAKFSGKEEDIEVGLAYYGARYYSPYLGVWASPDPVTLHDLGSDTNPYAFVHGSPIVGTDPDGRVLILAAILIGIAIGAALGAGSNFVAQGIRTNWDLKNIDGVQVLASGLIGAAAGGVSGGLGVWTSTAVTGGLGAGSTAAAAGSVAGGIVGGAAGGAVSYSLNSLAYSRQYGSFSLGGLGKSMAISACGGLAGASTGALLGGDFWGSVAAGFAGSGASYGSSVMLGGQASWQSFGLSMGSGLAGALASEGVQDLELWARIEGGTTDQRSEERDALRKVWGTKRGQEMLQQGINRFSQPIRVHLNDEGENFSNIPGVTGLDKDSVVQPQLGRDTDYITVDPSMNGENGLPLENMVDPTATSPSGPFNPDAAIGELTKMEIAIAHEMGHSFTHTYDNGPGRMNNVIKNENPVRMELHLPFRSQY